MNPAWRDGSTPEPQFVEVTIHALEAELSGNSRTLEIITDLYTPANAQLTIDASAFESGTEALELSIEASDISEAEFVLAYRGDIGFWITDPNVVAYHADSPPLVDRSEARAADPNGYREFDEFMGLKLQRGIISQKEYDALQAILRGPDNVEFTTDFTAEETAELRRLADVIDAKVPSELLQAAALSIEGNFSETEAATDGAVLPVMHTTNEGSLDPAIRGSGVRHKTRHTAAPRP